MQVVVLVEVEAIDLCERAVNVTRLGDRNGVVQCCNRRAGLRRELTVERCKLRPVLRLLDVQRSNRRLQDVRTSSAERQRALERCSPRRDPLTIPERSILVAEEDDRSFRKSSLAAGVADLHPRPPSLLP